MYEAGWSRCQIAVKAQGYAMMGYGMWQHRARGYETPLYARAVCLRAAEGSALLFCCLDLGYVTQAMRSGVLAQLRAQLGPVVQEAMLVLTCTHTHSGPGGCSHEGLYNLVTPGFVSDNLQQVVQAASTALLTAWREAAPTEVQWVSGQFDEHVPVAWNRSLDAYNRNPEVQPLPETQAHRALDRQMPLLLLRRQGELQALVSWFGVHATAVGNTQHKYCADNKGYAACTVEERLRAAGVANAVAIFAQGTAGDVSPHYHGPGDIARRQQWQGDMEYAYARRNGELQAEQALAIAHAATPLTLSGPLDGMLSYADFSVQHADPRYANGEAQAWTSEPCHGVSFFTGTRVDGPGMPAALGLVARRLARSVRKTRLRKLASLPEGEQVYYRRLYDAQGSKDILLEAGRKQILGQALDKLWLPGMVDPVVGELKRQVAAGALQDSALVPTVLPLQLLRIGPVVIICCPGEFTTIAGRRLLDTVRAQWQASSGISQVLVCTYCNEYMGYVTTREEYELQRYEGGHTIFGQWTLAAFQTRFAELARELPKPDAQRRYDRGLRPLPVPAAELARRSDLPVPRT